MKEKTHKESLQIFQIKGKISTVLSQNVFQSRVLRSELLFQDPQLSSQIEFHKNTILTKMFIQQWNCQTLTNFHSL